MTAFQSSKKLEESLHYCSWGIIATKMGEDNRGGVLQVSASKRRHSWGGHRCRKDKLRGVKTSCNTLKYRDRRKSGKGGEIGERLRDLHWPVGKANFLRMLEE